MCVFKDFLVLGNLKVSCDSFDLIFFVFYGFFLQFLLGGAGEIFPILFPLEFLRLLLNINLLNKSRIRETNNLSTNADSSTITKKTC